MEEVRGVWIANRPHSQVLSSKANIAQAMDFLAQMGFNVVFPVVWNQGFTLFHSQVMLKYGFDEIDKFFVQDGGNRDPLAELIIEAHSRGIAVIPWFEYGFACSARADGGHILAKNPHWAARDQNDEVVRHGGLTWMNALDLEVQQFMLDLVLEVAQNFDIDGIQGDDRLPALPSTGGYDAGIKSCFRAQFDQNPPKFDQTPPLNTEDPQWVQWRDWRAGILTDFLARLCDEVKAVRQNLVVSMAPGVFPFCFNHLLQDSNTWVEKGLVDLICPQVYRETFDRYQDEINKVNNLFTAEQRAKFAPGIAFRANSIDVSSEDLLQYIGLNRNSGFRGQLFFHFEGLKRNISGVTIAQALKEGPYSQMTSLPLPFRVGQA